jgi:hypothetical protein
VRENRTPGSVRGASNSVPTATGDSDMGVVEWLTYQLSF